ncbi:hypothetical protein ACHAXS_000863 [Conticribra weissflogii]
MTNLSDLAAELPAPYPPSIRVSRSKARRMIDLCEQAEMTCNFDDIAGAGGKSSGEEISPYITVIEMALLLYLGEYTHARHLWRRCRDFADVSSGADDGGCGEMERAQLELLWIAARYCYLWSSGGLHSLKSGLGGLRRMEGAASNDDGIEDVHLPFSALALKALHSCQETKMEPLATYSGELIEDFRYKVNNEMHRSFGRIKVEEFRVRLNLECTGEADDECFNNYGWLVDASGQGDRRSGVYLVPDPEWEQYYQDDGLLDDDDAHLSNENISNHQDVVPHQFMSNDERIRKLTDVVMFMEQPKMNA